MYGQTSQIYDIPDLSTVERSFTDRLVSGLVITGIVGAWLAWVIVAYSTGASPDESFFGPRSKPFVYYIFHAAGIFSVLAAGILAFFKGHYRRLGGITRAAFWFLVITSVTWSLIAYDLDDYLSWQALGSTGPLVWLTSVLIFAGMDRSVWKSLEPVIEVIAYITAVLALFTIVTTYGNLDERWFSAPVQYMVLLIWFGGWTFITAGSRGGWRLFLRCVPFIVFVFTAIVTRTRSWFLMSILLFIVTLFCSRHEEQMEMENRRRRLKVFIAVGVVFLIAGVLLQDPLLHALDAFSERALDDTRSEQYVEFFSQVPLSDLVLGRGPNGTWFWQGEYYQFFDNAYLWMAFIGGLPTLLAYFILVIVPGVRAYVRGASGRDAAAAALIILWGLACSGFSTYISPSLSPYSYLVYLMAGRCLGYLAEKENR